MVMERQRIQATVSRGSPAEIAEMCSRAVADPTVGAWLYAKLGYYASEVTSRSGPYSDAEEHLASTRLSVDTVVTLIDFAANFARAPGAAFVRSAQGRFRAARIPFCGRHTDSDQQERRA